MLSNKNTKHSISVPLRLRSNPISATKRKNKKYDSLRNDIFEEKQDGFTDTGIMWLVSGKDTGEIVEKQASRDRFCSPLSTVHGFIDVRMAIFRFPSRFRHSLLRLPSRPNDHHLTTHRFSRALRRQFLPKRRRNLCFSKIKPHRTLGSRWDTK